VAVTSAQQTSFSLAAHGVRRADVARDLVSQRLTFGESASERLDEALVAFTSLGLGGGLGGIG
jgi:hypothetical protein